MDELLEDFLGDAGESLDIIEAELLRLEQRPGDAAILNGVLRHLHTIKGACGFLGLERVAALAECAEGFLAAARSNGAALPAQGADALLRCFDRMKGVLAGIAANGAEPKGDDAALLTELTEATPQASAQIDPTQDIPKSRDETVRVSATALESLAERAADLARARDNLERLAALPEYHALLTPMAALSKTASDLLALAEHLRRRNASEAFRPLQRVAREAAATLGKHVKLEFSGGDLAFDAHIVEAMKGPLVHLVRNAIAHGIEMPAERAARGKSEIGVIRISASATMFSISDDGAGLDPALIRRRGIENGMIGAAHAARLSDTETLDLLFAPGFSTSARISAFAGRGIGLDAVKSSVERLGARIAVEAAPGAGATFTVTLPTRAEQAALPQTVVLDPQDAVHERLKPLLAAAGYDIAARSALEEPETNTPIRQEQTA